MASVFLVVACSGPPIADTAPEDVATFARERGLSCSDLETVSEYRKGRSLRIVVVSGVCEKVGSDRPGRTLAFEAEYGKYAAGWRHLRTVRLDDWTGEARGDLPETKVPGRSKIDKGLLVILGIPFALVVLVLALRFIGGAKKGYATVARRLTLKRPPRTPHQQRSFDSVTSIDQGDE